MPRSFRVLTLMLAVALVGCGSSSPVVLLTSEPGHGGCYLSGIEGDLVADQTYGTVILQAVQKKTGPSVMSWPVRWPQGYTGRRSGSQVEVLDRAGHTVAQTGTRVHIGGGGESTPISWVVCGLTTLDGRNYSVWVLP